MNLIQEFIKDKYKLSEKVYNIQLKNEPYNIFLFYFDILNVYNLFPTILEFDISTNINNFELYDIEDNNNETLIKYVNENKEYKKILKNTIKELQGNYEESDSKFTRKLFSYEIIDTLVDNYNAEYVTTAFLKCYELLKWYNLVNFDNNTINYFGICEQPGAFVYAINHYIKTNSKSKFNFVLQSLRTSNNKGTGFRAENHLYNSYKDKYDYALGSGDVTDINNILYYRKKYYNHYFDIITADCGLDCSDDYSLQENKIFKIFFGQVLVALSVADKKTNYIAKLFTIYSIQTANIILLLTLFFDQVLLTRVLTTKPVSGEVYLVCKNFKYTKEEMNSTLEKLYDMFKNNIVPSVKNLDLTNYYQTLTNCNETLLYRRIIAYRFSYFRYNNKEYTTNNNQVIEYINTLVKHYTDYYTTLYSINKLNDDDKLVKHKFINKWSKDNKK